MLLQMNGQLPIPLLAGFECSSFRRSDGTRIDMVASTHHDDFAERDFNMLRDLGISQVREGLRWHLIEPERGVRNWASADVLMAAARATGVEIIWDLLHFGLPDWVNPFHPDFPSIFADFAGEFAVRAGPGIYVPINEISFMAWAAGDVGYMFPYAINRGPELKLALCRAAIAAITAIRRASPSAKIMAVEPMIEVHARGVDDNAAALAFHEAQFEAADILTGSRHPDLGGSPTLIDMLGVNHYPHSQWFADRTTVPWPSAQWSPLSALLAEVYQRYGIPLILAETGCEGAARGAWFDYVMAECKAAIAAGIPLVGICLYPIVSHVAWTGERYCPNGLWDGASPDRVIFNPLADRIRRETIAFAGMDQ